MKFKKQRHLFAFGCWSNCLKRGDVGSMIRITYGSDRVGFKSLRSFIYFHNNPTQYVRLEPK